MKPVKVMNKSRYLFLPVGIAAMLFLSLSLLGYKNSTNRAVANPGIKKVGHVVVIYMENHSFDNLYGQFAGADGLSNADSNVSQVDEAGNTYNYLPAIPGTSMFPTNLANNYFNIDQYIPSDQLIPDVLHKYYQEQMQINGGKMNKYAFYNNTKGLTMGYYKTSLLPLVAFAKKYTLCDHFFHSAFGCSYLNHQWLISAATPVFHNAPSSIVAKVDANGKLTSDGVVTPDGYAVNTIYTVNTPHPKGTIPANLLPSQTNPTIGDRLSEKGISWAWYSGGWNNAIAGKPDPSFQFHHQPFAYYTKYADGTKAKKEHLKDETEFLADAKNGKLPAVCFVKPLGTDNEHPGSSTIMHGEGHAVQLINAVLNGPNGKDAVVILTYDENGGFWDHVAPPVIDRFGPGTRIPAIIISPFAKKGYVDHTRYETVSILAFIEKRWGLKPLTNRDKNANPFQNAFSF
ncbi:alkaline phosphatase family protein [Mucilaginibacter sp. SP1R1]|uniref:alkaline phosphatase family protein n=1 Tax=Mucilaginibacter sp. SP1R1 TaxID=2723091 RepID=UPI0017F46DD0|nr:alkaline phosphatase family protein [Mucilaginibacter sp. SP1R1]MBB6148562.1 phospholipase C [Mucilaginibacter sp. SP1R1]